MNHINLLKKLEIFLKLFRRLKSDDLVRCPWLDDVCSMAEKAGESLRKCAVHNDQLMTHFDLVNKKPACEVTSEILLRTNLISSRTSVQ